MHKNKWFIVIVGFVAIILVLSWQFKVVSFGYYWIKMRGVAAEWQAQGVWLPYYRVTIEAKEIRGITKNASGLTYNRETGTLFSVINAPPEIVELSTDGYLLRRIQLEGTRDPEGITHVGGSLFVISDERSHKEYRHGGKPVAALGKLVRL